MTDKIFSLELFESIVGEAWIKRGRNALDLEAVKNFHLDRRGRIEAGIKPAPPETEPSAYGRITKRGGKLLPECRSHGKKEWCIHTVVLALYHLDIKPNYLVKSKPKANLEDQVQVGYRTRLNWDQEGLWFRIESLSTGSYIHQPFEYLLKEKGLFDWSPRALELLEDLAEPQGDRFFIPRLDASPLMAALEGSVLYPWVGDQPLQRKRLDGPAPELRVGIKKDRVHWTLAHQPEGEVTYLPGMPGFLCAGSQILRYQDPVADFQGFAADEEAALTAPLLRRLLGQKHQTKWQGKKPKVIRELDGVGVRLEVNQGSLQGQVGVWAEGRFYPIDHVDRGVQVVQGGRGPALLDCPRDRIALIQKEMGRVKAPWQGTSFSVNAAQAPDFLERFKVSKDWFLDRDAADRWFGLQALDMETVWPQGEGQGLKPYYLIDGERFEHDQLLSGLDGEAGGIHLPGGRHLKVDGKKVAANQLLLEGVANLHEDEARRRELLTRLTEPTEMRIPDLSLVSPKWRKLLRSYQLEGVAWLLDNHRHEEPSLLADDMGLGKTVQTLAFLDLVRDDLPQLVIVPTSLLWNWRSEAEKFCAHRKVCVHHGPKRAKNADALQVADLIFTSYGTVLRDLEMLYDVHFQCVVLDEAQAVKNPESQTHQAVCELWSDHRVALTGTPVENRISELWAIFQFLAAGYLAEGKQDVGLPGSPGYEALKTKVKPFLKRRLKTEVEKDLPAKEEMVVRLPMSDNQQAMYHQVRKQSLQELTSDGGKKQNTMSILTKLLRLRQIACHPGLVDDTRLTSASNKFDFVLDQLEEIISAGHAALVFSQFTELLKLLKYQLEHRELEYHYLDGSTRNRQELVESFQSENGPPIFLISLKAGGTGLTLTKASYVFHLDPWWNPMVEAQATDRAHRIGQTKSVISYKVISEGTIEERILKLQAGKKFLAEGLWQDAESLAAQMDHETLLALLN